MSFTGGFTGGLIGGFAGGSSGVVPPTPVVTGQRPCGCATICLCPARFHLSGDYACRLSRIVDRARDISARLGLRPYALSFVHVRWTGKTMGDGVEEVVTQRPILPVPLVDDMSGILREMGATQINEAGTVLVSEISAGYTEDQILCRPSTGKPLPRNEAIYYEIQLPPRGERRRMVTADTGVPTFDPVNGWTIALRFQQGARGRSGANR